MKLLSKINLNIGQKLLAGFGTIFGFILLNGLLTVGINIYTNVMRNKITNEYDPVSQSLNQMETLIAESKRLTVSWVYIDHQPDSPDKVTLRQITDSTFDAVVHRIKGQTVDWDQSFTDSLAYVEDLTHQMFELQRTIMNGLNSFEAYDDVMVMMEAEMLIQNDGDIVSLEQQINSVNASLNKMFNEKCDVINSRLSALSIMQTVFVIIMSLLVMAMSGGVGYVLYQSIVNPLKQGVHFAQAIGKGDLTASVEVTQNDEIGQLAQALTDMVSNLKHIVVSIEQNANNLVDSGEMLKSSSLKLSKGASEQAASAEEVSTAIEEMVANIDQNTENAIATEKITSSTAENVLLSSQYSNEAAEAMSLISQKITIISDIAFQTNILALNAAVEAVRAGEHGRGFSVVAAEVRKLAERSKQAANEIVSLVAKGMKVSQMAGEKAKALVPDIEKTTVLIKEISAASIEQKTGAEQINMAMQNLNVITQENASSSDELTNGSVQLSSLATNLKSAVGFFKIDEFAVDNAEESTDNENSAPSQPERPATSSKTAMAQDSRKVQVKSKPKVETSNLKGTTINLGSTSEYDLENYEKF